MATMESNIKLNIETLLDGEPVELEYIKQAVKEKREREHESRMCYVTISQGSILNDVLHLPKDKHYEILSTKIDCDGNVVLCLSGDDLPVVKDGEEIPYGYIVCKAAYYDNDPIYKKTYIEFPNRVDRG